MEEVFQRIDKIHALIELHNSSGEVSKSDLIAELTWAVITLEDLCSQKEKEKAKDLL